MLEQSYQKVYKDKYVQVSQDNNNQWFSCARATYLKVVNYLDLRTVDVDDNPVRKSKSETKTYYSPNYNNESHLKSKALSEYKMFQGMSMYLDLIP